MQKVMSNRWAIAIFVLPTLLLLGYTVVTPILTSFYYGTLEWSIGSAKSFVGLDNFVRLFSDTTIDFPSAIGRNFLFALSAIVIQLPIAFMLASVLALGIKGEGFFRSVFFVPVVVSSMAICQLWLKMYNNDYGLFNTLLTKIGLESWTRDWLGDVSIALIAVIAVPAWQYIGYYMLLFYAGIKTINTEIIEAAKIDGASYFRTLRSIILPMMLPVLEICVTFAVIGSMKTFDHVYVMTQGGPLNSTEVMSTLMYRTIFSSMEYGYGSAMSSIIVLICIVTAIVIQRIFRRNYKND